MQKTVVFVSLHDHPPKKTIVVICVFHKKKQAVSDESAFQTYYSETPKINAIYFPKRKKWPQNRF
jgi:hypothetical protein